MKGPQKKPLKFLSVFSAFWNGDTLNVRNDCVWHRSLESFCFQGLVCEVVVIGAFVHCNHFDMDIVHNVRDS